MELKENKIEDKIDSFLNLNFIGFDDSHNTKLLISYVNTAKEIIKELNNKKVENKTNNIIHIDTMRVALYLYELGYSTNQINKRLNLGMPELSEDEK